mgnify:CR=1 FL=1
MSKKMKIFTAGALGIMMAGLVLYKCLRIRQQRCSWYMVRKQSFYGRYE